MPRLIRRKPWGERMKDYLNPQDFLLWLSEEFETREWDIKGFANSVGAALNFVFLVARANSTSNSSINDDVFGDSGGPGWFSWFVWASPSLTWSPHYYAAADEKYSVHSSSTYWHCSALETLHSPSFESGITVSSRTRSTLLQARPLPSAFALILRLYLHPHCDSSQKSLAVRLPNRDLILIPLGMFGKLLCGILYLSAYVYSVFSALVMFSYIGCSSQYSHQIRDPVPRYSPRSSSNCCSLHSFCYCRQISHSRPRTLPSSTRRC